MSLKQEGVKFSEFVQGCTEATAPADDDYIALDGSNGTRKMAASVLAKAEDVEAVADDIGTIQNETKVLSLDSSIPYGMLGTSFKAGESVVISVSCDDETFSKTISGNVKFSDGTWKYPTIKMSAGKGSLSLKYDKDGSLDNFGFPSLSSSVVLTFEIKVYSANYSSSLSQRVTNLETEEVENEENIASISKQIGNPYVSKEVNKTFSSSSTYVNFNVGFKANELIVIKATSTYTSSFFFDGNAEFSDGTKVYPTINMVSGEGTKTLKYDKAGTLTAFGPHSVSDEMDVTFEILVYSEDYSSSIKARVNSLYGEELDALLPISSTPLETIKQNAGFGSVLLDWGFIGDSLSSGELEFTYGGSKKYIDFYDNSWGQRLCRLLGCNGYNFSAGGRTAKLWCNGTGARDWGGASTNKKKAYTIAFGVNDAWLIKTGELSLGTIDDVKDDYTENADSFYGWYAGIIQRIKSVQPSAKIFVVTLPNTDSSESVVNPAIRDMVAKFTNVFLIDLYNYAPNYGDSSFKAAYFNNGHMSEAGYQYTAFLMNTYIDWIVRNNPSNFKLCHLIGTEYDDGNL